MGYDLWGAVVVSLAFTPTSLADLFWSGYENCPLPCHVVGHNPSNWTQYHTVSDLDWCRERLLFDLGLHNPLEEPGNRHITIRSCAVTDASHTETPSRSLVSLLGGQEVWAINNTESASHRNSSETAACGSSLSALERSSVNVRIAWGGPADNTDARDTAAATEDLMRYLEAEPNCASTIVFAKAGQAVVGLYVGSQIEKAGAASIVKDAFAARTSAGKVPIRVGAQICGPEPYRAQTFGIYADNKGNISAVQAVVRDWSTGICFSEFDQEEVLEGTAVGILSAIMDETSITVNSPDSNGEHERKREPQKLHSRATCSYAQADPGDGCWALTQKCKISQADLIRYNGGKSDFCSTLKSGQYVCCGPGTLPDFSPQPNPDGSCKSYAVKADDTCATIAAANQISNYTKLEEVNKQTWGFAGCRYIQPGQYICLSSGDPPMPAPVTDAVCGPQVRGTVRPTNGTKLADLNPCPLNVCCNIWGNCGLSSDFCVYAPADTGAPGTSKPGIHGCVSNCGMDIVHSPNKPQEFRIVGYFESWNKQRPCLNMDVSKLVHPEVKPPAAAHARYTHIHFAFPDITPQFTVDVSKVQDQFDSFKALSGLKKIVSFGGWDFSNYKDSYAIFRTMVATEVNRQKAARNVIRFLTEHNIDGLDFDWEYPGAIDIPGTPEGSPDEGANYLKFLRTVRNSLPSGKTLSIAAPSSFWYLKNFPIKDMSEILDYIIYMTYDLHGQWDAGNKWASPGCPTGNCLRHHTNKTEVELSLALITKAGVPSHKVVVGMPLYGRSFKMAEKGCTGPDCLFLGDRFNSQAAKGACTDTAGYISNVEIRDIINSNAHSDLYGERMVREIADEAGDIVVYDDTEWVSWMKPSTYLARAGDYETGNFGGTSDWAIDLNFDFGKDGRDDKPYDEDAESQEPTCDYDRTFNDLEDLKNNAGGLSLYCRQIYVLQVLEKMLSNLYAEYNSVNNGYDTKFAAYVRYINRITPYAINDFMTNKDGLKYFNCVKEPPIGPSKSGQCFDFSEAERNEGTFDMTITLRDRDGFFTDLLSKTGVAEEWINFNGHERDIVYCSAPAQGAHMCSPASGLRDWYGWPQKNDHIDVPNPKDIITKTLGNIADLRLSLVTTKWEIMMGGWNGDVDDVLQVMSVPIFMLAEAVEGMKQAKEMGEDEEQWEDEQARNKAKQLILTIIGAVLFVVPFVGEVGAVLAGASTLARFALIAGETANLAFGIYEMVDNPDSAIMGVLGMMFGLGSIAKVPKTPQGFKEMAGVRAGLRNNGGVSKIGRNFQKWDDQLQDIIKFCRT